MKKRITLVALVFALAACLSMTAADRYVPLRQSVDAAVLEVIDSDALIARVSAGLALVRLVGVDAAGYDGGFAFLSNELTGAAIRIVPDTAAPVEGRYTAAYVYKNGRLMNEALLASGRAKLRVTDKDASLYKNLQSAEAAAKSAKLGAWADRGVASANYAGSRVNVNTASAEQLREALGQANATLANEIVSYRAEHPFETLGELKFVPGMTKAVYDAVRQKLVVSTNVATASVTELTSLRDVDEATAKAVIDYRARYGLTDPYALYTSGLMSSGVYNENRPFMAAADVTHIVYAAPNISVNLNLATIAQLQNAGLTYAQAARLAAERGALPQTTLYGALAAADTAYYSYYPAAAYVNRLADNLHVFTDLNRASEDELRSVFAVEAANSAAVAAVTRNRPFTDVAQLAIYLSAADYARVAPWLYVSAPVTDTVNLNTATKDQLAEAGLSDAQAAAVSAKRGQMRVPGDIPVTLSPAGFSLYTNVNTASAGELATLGEAFTAELIAQILAYRADQPFGSYDEFAALVGTQAVRGISAFITVR